MMLSDDHVAQRRAEWSKRTLAGSAAGGIKRLQSGPCEDVRRRLRLVPNATMLSSSAAGPAGLAVMGAAVGGPIVFGANMPAGLMPAAFAQEAKKDGAPAAAPPAPRGPQLLQFPGKDGNLVVLGRCLIVQKMLRRLGHQRPITNGEVLHPQQWADPGGHQGARQLEDRRRRRGQQPARVDAGRTEVQVHGCDAPHGARMRRQRALVLHAAGARQPMDQRRRRQCRVDGRAARRRAEGRRGLEAVGRVQRALWRRPALVGRHHEAGAVARRADPEADGRETTCWSGR